MGTNGFTRNFDYSNTNNKLNSINVGINTYSYLYDNAGNQIQENSNRHFEWDFANNMRCFYNQAGMAEPTIYAQYLYDSAGNKVKKIVRTQGGNYESISYIDGMFEYKTNGTDEQTTTHIMDDTSRIAMIRTGYDFGDTTPTIKYNLEDYLGSSCILLETNGALINKEEYYPFGETSFGSYAKKRYRYSGKEKDEESGLYYFGARYYLSMSCRFISCDPLSVQYAEHSAYAYVFNNPIMYNDPTGMEGKPVVDNSISNILKINLSNTEFTEPEGAENNNLSHGELDLNEGFESDPKDRPKKRKGEFIPVKKLKEISIGGKDNDRRDVNANRGPLKIKIEWGHRMKDKWGEGEVLYEGNLTWGDNVDFEFNVESNEKVKIKGYNQTTYETSKGKTVVHNKYLGDTYSGGWDGPSQGQASAKGKFFMNPNSDPELSYSLDYKITKYKRIQKPGLNRLRITIIPRPKVSRAQRKVDRTVLKHVRR